jgi:beta-N-acetylhexosaminidase
VTDLETLALRVLMGSFVGPELPTWTHRLLDAGLGSVCLFGSNVGESDELATLTAAMHGAAPDLLVAIDEEGGDVTRLHAVTGSHYPGNAALGVVDDLTLTEAVAHSIGASLAAAGVDLDLAPVVDVNSDPRNPVIGVRSFGADPELVARHTTAYTTGLQSAGVGACAKHFPGHGDTTTDSHLDLPTVAAPREVLAGRELVPFGAAVAAGTLAVMTAHVLLPAIDPRLPASLSPTVLSLLRRDLGFDGLVVSDAVDMSGVSAGRGAPAAAVLALAAGNDLICLGASKDESDHLAVVDAVVAAVRDGVLAEDRLVEAAGRVQTASKTVQSWRAAPPANDSGQVVDDGIGTEAALRAVRVVGTLPPLTGAVVLRLRTGSNIAVGEVPWGLPTDGAVLGGRSMVDVRASTPFDDVLRAVGNAPAVVLVREPQRHPWTLALLDSLAAAHPEIVVVDMGWPGDAQLLGAAVVSTYGASQASGAALDRVLMRRQ